MGATVVVDFMCARIYDDMQVEVHKDVLRSMIEQDDLYRVLDDFSVEILGVAPDTGAYYTVPAVQRRC